MSSLRRYGFHVVATIRCSISLALLFTKLIESISVSEVLQLIEQYPSLLRRPIIIDTKRMQIGFNEDEIRAFLPRSYRKQELKEARMRAGIS